MSLDIISKKEAQNKKLKKYFTGKPCKHGHISERFISGVCVECSKIGNLNRRDYQYNYRINNNEKILDYQNVYRKENQEKIKDYQDNYRVMHKKEKEEYNKKYRKENYDKLKNYHNNYIKKRKKEDELFLIAWGLRDRLNKAIKNNAKSGSAVKDLGCSIEYFKSYLETLFQPGMTWDNWGTYGWHIDHIKPLSLFDLTDREQFLEAAHYTNMQPLWAKDNLSKSNKIILKEEI